MKLLQAVVEVEDPATGTIRLRRDVATVDEMSLDTRSTITVRVGPARHERRVPARPRVAGDRLLRPVRRVDRAGAPGRPDGRGHRSPPGRRGGRHLARSAPRAVPRLRSPARATIATARAAATTSSAAAGTVGWEAIVTADRTQFERLAVAGVSFPADYPERRFALPTARTGSGGAAERGRQAPEIDLAAAPADPGVSRLHAMLERRSDGAIVVRDLGSTNGTMVNDDPVPIAPQSDPARRRRSRPRRRVDHDHGARAEGLEIVARERRPEHDRDETGASRSGADRRGRTARTGRACEPSQSRRSSTPRRRSEDWSRASSSSTRRSGDTARSAASSGSR